MDIIEIEKENLPESFEMDLAQETFIFTFKYNETGDYFTCDLGKIAENGEQLTLLQGEKIALNKYLFSDFTNQEFPAPAIIPLDESGTVKRITWENMGEKVFLYIDDEGGSVA